MKKVRNGILLIALTGGAVRPAAAAFVVGGENGWQFSTDGIVDVFADYRTTGQLPTGSRFISFLGSNDQNFGVEVGLLPSVVAFNVKAPTVNGVDSTVRIGIYPSIQNKSQNTRFETNPNIDFREIYYTAKGKYGELLAGRALNLYQGKNILTDMTLLTAGVVPGPATTTTLGHIGYGYLYTNFGPQLRYTTPDLNGIKVAVSVNEPYKISADTAKTPTPRIESEVSYATVLKGGSTFQYRGVGDFALYAGRGGFGSIRTDLVGLVDAHRHLDAVQIGGGVAELGAEVGIEITVADMSQGGGSRRSRNHTCRKEGHVGQDVFALVEVEGAAGEQLAIFPFGGVVDFAEVDVGIGFKPGVLAHRHISLW